ncbi:MAG: hypothetical protein JSW34_12285 [Candidatus Zixiibacteriota bacterium]|nr:MAG: hypothetical protein JSW34_12285 [candidate division Zixibacteria bacterium]
MNSRRPTTSFILMIALTVFAVLGPLACGAALADTQPPCAKTCKKTGVKACQADTTKAESTRCNTKCCPAGPAGAIRGDDLLTLPVRTVEEALLFRNGVVEIRPAETSNGFTLGVRSGDPWETGYFLNNVPVNNQQIGLSTFSASRHAVCCLDFQPGGYPAHRGFLGSGIVDVIAPHRQRALSAMVETVSDDLMGDGAGQNWYTARLSGPVPISDGSSFFGLVERRDFVDRNPSSITTEILPDEPDCLPHNWLDGWSYHGRVDLKLHAMAKLAFTVDGSTDEWSRYLHEYLFDLDHTPYYKQENLALGFRLSGRLSDRARYGLGLQLFRTEYFRGDGLYREDLLDYYVANGNLRFDPTALFWADGHVWDDYLRKKSSYLAVGGNLNTSVTSDIEVGGSFQVRPHVVRSYNHLFPTRVLGLGGFYDIDRYGYDSVGSEIEEEGWRNAVKQPKDLAASLSARLERGNIVGTVGIRVDRFRYDARPLRNLERPLDPDTLEDDASFTLDESDLDEESSFTYLSPRLALGARVSENTRIHAGVGRYMQRLPFDLLYFGEDYAEHKIQLGGYFYALGNPALEPVKTLLIEVGVEQRLGASVRAGLTYFRKEIDGLPQVYAQGAFPSSYITYRNGDERLSTGLEFSLLATPTHYLGINVRYTVYPSAVSALFLPRNVAWSSETPLNEGFYAGFQRHKIVGHVDLNLGRGEGPRLGSVRPLENFRLGALVRAGSGLPYSPSEVYNEVTLSASAPTVSAARNSAFGPWTFHLDLVIEKTFEVAGLKIVPFVWVKNLMDRDNVYDVYEGTGEANTTGWLETEAGLYFIDRYSDPTPTTGLDGEDSYILKENDPLHYGLPRQIFVGLRAAF